MANLVCLIESLHPNRDRWAEAALGLCFRMGVDRWTAFTWTPTQSAALTGIRTRVVLLDCLTLLASNVFVDVDLDANAQALFTEINALLTAAGTRDGELIIVSNEIGSGIVPENALSRAYRDALGTANQQVARAADSVTLLVSGLPLEVKAAR